MSTGTCQFDRSDSRNTQHARVVREAGGAAQHQSEDAHAGRPWSIIGESGCGKTVLLKTLIGLVRPTQGRGVLRRQEPRQLNDKELTHERTRYGFLFQGAALFDSLTVHPKRFVSAQRTHHTKPPTKFAQAATEKLGEVGLPVDVAAKRPAELSGGMRKRVGLARALALNPEIMLYDEPTTGLDPIMSDVINELIVRTRKLHPVTSIVVTHDMNTVRKVADRVVMLFPLSRLRPTNRKSFSTARRTPWNAAPTNESCNSSAAKPANA